MRNVLGEGFPADLRVRLGRSGPARKRRRVEDAQARLERPATTLGAGGATPMTGARVAELDPCRIGTISLPLAPVFQPGIDGRCRPAKNESGKGVVVKTGENPRDKREHWFFTTNLTNRMSSLYSKLGCCLGREALLSFQERSSYRRSVGHFAGSGPPACWRDTRVTSSSQIQVGHLKRSRVGRLARNSSPADAHCQCSGDDAKTTEPSQ